MREPNREPRNHAAPPAGELDALIKGAGFAGQNLLRRLPSLGFTAKVFKSGAWVGGTCDRAPLLI